MSAVVHPKCGHASHLMEVDCLADTPQVHVHFLTEDLEFSYVGFSKLELCCHGCGESLLVYYDVPGRDDTRHIDLRDAFQSKHKSCPNRDYEDTCPNWRTSFSTADLRATPKKRGFRGTRAHGGRAGPVPTPGPSVLGNGRRPVRKETSKGGR